MLKGGLGPFVEREMQSAYPGKAQAQAPLSYTALAQSWPEIQRLAREGLASSPQQQDLFD